MLFFFFFNDTATTEIYTLSLHDALPISRNVVSWSAELRRMLGVEPELPDATRAEAFELVHPEDRARVRETLDRTRSEEHTSELQSQSNLVCRLLLEKKKKTNSISMT